MSRVKRGIIGLFLLLPVSGAHLLLNLFWIWPRKARFRFKYRKVMRYVAKMVAPGDGPFVEFMEFVESTREGLKKEQRMLGAFADVDFDSDAGKLLVFNQCIKHVHAVRMRNMVKDSIDEKVKGFNLDIYESVMRRD